MHCHKAFISLRMMVYILTVFAAVWQVYKVSGTSHSPQQANIYNVDSQTIHMHCSRRDRNRNQNVLHKSFTKTQYQCIGRIKHNLGVLIIYYYFTFSFNFYCFFTTISDSCCLSYSSVGSDCMNLAYGLFDRLHGKLVVEFKVWF